MTRQALSLILARDLAEVRVIDAQRRAGDWHNVTNGRLLMLNSRIAVLQAQGITPLFS